VKGTPGRRGRQASPHQAAAVFASSGHLTANAYVIRPGKTKYGPRNRGKREYAQGAIAALFPVVLPKHISYSALHRKVNEELRRNPEYLAVGFGELSRQTVMRALQTLRAANR
jgi:hypothetical protein